MKLLLVFSASFIVPTFGHIWNQCPRPRNCFYFKDDGDPDDTFRKNPCSGKPMENPTVMRPGSEICLRVRICSS
jgi:hypothetical protein